MVPNSRIVPPPSIPNTYPKDHNVNRPSPYTPESSLKEDKSTRYLSRIVPPPTTTSQGAQRQHQPYVFTNPMSMGASHQPLPPIAQHCQQVKRKPLGDHTNSTLAQLPNSNSYQQLQHQQHQQSLSQAATLTTRPRNQDRLLQSPPLSPPASSASSSSAKSPNYDSFLDTSFFQGQDRSYSTDALTADDAKKVH